MHTECCRVYGNTARADAHTQHVQWSVLQRNIHIQYCGSLLLCVYVCILWSVLNVRTYVRMSVSIQDLQSED